MADAEREKRRIFREKERLAGEEDFSSVSSFLLISELFFSRVGSGRT